AGLKAELRGGGAAGDLGDDEALHGFRQAVARPQGGGERRDGEALDHLATSRRRLAGSGRAAAQLVACTKLRLGRPGARPDIQGHTATVADDLEADGFTRLGDTHETGRLGAVLDRLAVDADEQVADPGAGPIRRAAFG